MFFCFSLDYFVLVLFAFVVLDLVSSVQHQEIGWEELLQNDLAMLVVGAVGGRHLPQWESGLGGATP